MLAARSSAVHADSNIPSRIAQTRRLSCAAPGGPVTSYGPTYTVISQGGGWPGGGFRVGAGCPSGGGFCGRVERYLRRVISFWRDVSRSGGVWIRILPISALVSGSVQRSFVLGCRVRVGSAAGWHASEVVKGLPGQRVLSQNGADGHGEHRKSLLSVRREPEPGPDQGGGADGS